MILGLPAPFTSFYFIGLEPQQGILVGMDGKDCWIETSSLNATGNLLNINKFIHRA
jgi:hypothetical protein